MCGRVASRSAPTSTAFSRLGQASISVKRPQLLRLRALAMVLLSESRFPDKALEIQPAVLKSVKAAAYSRRTGVFGATCGGVGLWLLLPGLDLMGWAEPGVRGCPLGHSLGHSLGRIPLLVTPSLLAVKF